MVYPSKLQYLTSTNPAKNYKIIGRVAISTDREIEKAVMHAKAINQIWKEMGVKKRIAILRKIYDGFFKRKEELLQLIIAETGKTVRFARAEFERHAADYAWFIDNGEKALQDQVTFEDNKSIHKIVY